MSETLKLRYKVGEIEFEAEGLAADVEQQRVNFMNIVLPAAVDAMVQTRKTITSQYIDTSSQQLLEAGNDILPIESTDNSSEDLSRTSLAAFLKQYGSLTEQDFTLFAAYFDEKKNKTECFSIEELKEYYSEARRQIPQNPSMSLNRLASKGLIMDSKLPDGVKSGKYYKVTDEGIKYIETYTPKENKSVTKTTRRKRTDANTESVYNSITADDLNLKNYPAVKNVKGVREQIILAMYIVTNEKKGEWFTVNDIIYIMTNIFGLPCDADKVNGVFKRNKNLFDKKSDDKNKKALQHRLLEGAKDIAKSLIEKGKE